ncbi:hypothetical protein, partial [Idiomarina zobellii]|uniref:hypothetical protein n=1 Tax=Idiomarina zobellii TaxID=86103 RepID=UPI001F43B557
ISTLRGARAWVEMFKQAYLRDQSLDQYAYQSFYMQWAPVYKNMFIHCLLTLGLSRVVIASTDIEFNAQHDVVFSFPSAPTISSPKRHLKIASKQPSHVINLFASFACFSPKFLVHPGK